MIATTDAVWSLTQKKQPNGLNRMHHELKAIREELRFSIGVFSTILGLKKATYQCYENGSRAVPKQVMLSAQAQLQRTRNYWAGMDARIDAHLSGGRCPNEIRRDF